MTPTDCCVLNSNVSEVEGFTPREVKWARGVMKLYHDLNSPNLMSLKSWLRQNMAKNVPVFHGDVDLALKIFKVYVPTLKGKSTAPRPPVVTTEDFIELPDELKHNGRKIELSIDMVYINDQSFLHSVDRTIKSKNLTVLGTWEKGENYDFKLLDKGIDNVLRH